MSIVSSKRSKTDFQLFNVLEDVSKYTFQITENTKIFPKRHRRTTSDKLQSMMVEIVACCYKANNVYMKQLNDFERRIKYQQIALDNISGMYGVIQYSYLNLHIEGRRVDHWCGLLIKLENYIKSWIKSTEKEWNNIHMG